MKKRLLLYVIMLFAFLSGKAQVGHAFYVEPGGSINLTNNIIIHNGGENLNIATPPFNLTGTDVRVFMDAESNFILYYYSPAVDAGNNASCLWWFDLADSLRICDGFVDLGAYELVDVLNHRNFVVHKRGGGNLFLCNNIIVNNPAHIAMTNMDNVPSSNILSDSISIFRDRHYDFSLFATSPAVDAGDNLCNNLGVDIQKNNRICGDAIDVGAYEQYVVELEFDSVYVVYQNDEGNLTLCNNIDINNSVYAHNTNVQEASMPNIFTDNDSLFIDNLENFMPRDDSQAIDAGSDACNTLAKDLAKKKRVMGEHIDIGAYEQYVASDDTLEWQYVVHQQPVGQLLLCNNVIVNNPAHFDLTNVAYVAANNILSDSIPIFCDPNLNFKPYDGSPAVDAGENSCNGLAVDIDMLPRIARAAIDVGAYELPERDTTTTGGGGGGGGGGGSDPGSDYYHTTVFHHDSDTLYLCNNIIINNSLYIENARPDADTVYNILHDLDTLFVDNLENFMPRENSIAVNRGANDCNNQRVDLAKHQRIYADIIDIGAYEQYVDEDDSLSNQLVIHQLGEGQLYLCNNIIVNNPAHADVTNVEDLSHHNILSDSVLLFRDELYDFSLWPYSPAVNAGDNDCCPLPLDIVANDRIIADTIDVGAFEFVSPILFYDTVYTVMQGDTVELWLCNNILINNGVYSVNTNISNLSADNIWQDNDSIFTDNHYNYLPLPQSIAVNQGLNDCNEVAVDLAKQTRIMAEIIDIGAYEQFQDDEDSLVIAAVHQVDTVHQLRLYNNIIINNPGHTHNYAGSIVDIHNMLEDTPDVFVDATNDYSLMEHSPAIDTGANEWVSWIYDLKDDERISCANIVDLGAFEYSYDNVAIALTYAEVMTDNCQGSYILLQATPGAQHYYWSHSNEDTCELVVMPLVSTTYTVVGTNGGACRDTATIQIFPATTLNDSLGTPSSIGKTFWLSYLRNHFREPTLTVQLSAERACSGTVSNPRTSWSVPFTVAAHGVTTVNIPLEQAYPLDANAVGDYGILVEADDTISVYAANYNHNSFDVTVVLPVNALDDDYMIQTYTPTMNSEFVIVATEDNTVVEITPSKALMGGHAARHTYTITMQRGQTYLGISRLGGVLGDLSGSVIKARDGKRIAVFNGNVCAMVPTDNSYTDHLVEQAMGVKYWGRSFALTSTQGQNFDMVRVTALRANTVISKNGTAIATIQTGETYEFELTGAEGSCYLETSQPAGVYLYIAGAVQGNNQELSDPSMIWIPPVEQQMNDLTFATFNSPGISAHYVNIVVPTEGLDEVSLDGLLIGNEFSLMPANPQFAFVRKQIQTGTHTLHCDQGFIAHVYGLGYHESYGYAAGSKAEALKEQLFVNDVLSANLPANQQFCPYETIDFRVEVNYSCDSVLWNFGDSSAIVNAMSTTHFYTEAGNYAVSATLYLTSGEVVFCTNMYVRISITDGFGTVYYDTVCYGEHYTQYGFDVEADEAGHFTHTRTVELPGLYCDSTYILELEVLNNVMLIEDTICEQNLYSEHGFNVLATDIGLLSDTLYLGTTPSGCDSLRILNLHVTPNMENIPDIVGETYPCVGEVFTYSLDSLAGLRDVVWTVPDSVAIVAQPDDYHISLLFESSDGSNEIMAQGHNKCGDTILRKVIYPQPYSFVQLVDTICANERHYQNYGFDIEYVPDSSDLYLHHDISSVGCDSTTVLAIVIMPTYQMYDTIMLCENELPYLYHDTLLATVGTHEIHLSTACDCDSLVYLTLIDMPVTTFEVDTTVRFSMLPFVFNEMEYDSIGVYTQTLTHANAYGCDSTIHIHLNVLYNVVVEDDSVICETDLPFVWNGVNFDYNVELTSVPVTLVDTARLPLPNGVDSIVVMTLHILPTTYASIDTIVLENDLPLQLNGQTYMSDSTFTQTLAGANANGCDSLLTVNLTIHYNVTTELFDTICETELPFTWNGLLFGAAGVQDTLLTASTGADSTVVVTLHVLPITYATIDTIVLENDLPLQLNGQTYMTDSTFTQTLAGANANGCDSILTVTLTVRNNLTTELSDTICETELPFTWNGLLFDAAGVQDTVLTASTGADSTVVMTLQVIPTTYATIDTIVLENDLPLQLNGQTYMSDSTFTQTLVGANAYGCDSLLTVNLTVRNNLTTELSDTICETELPFTWNGILFEAAGVQDTVLTASTGVDSTVVMSLHVLSITHATIDTIVLENNLPLQLNGQTYQTDSTFTQTLVGANAYGCDSLLTVNLTVRYNVITTLYDTICESQLPITWNGILFDTAGVQDTVLTASTGADSTVVMSLCVLPTTYATIDTIVLENDLPLQLNGQTYMSDSTFTQTLVGANAYGCDSILTVNLIIHYNVITALSDTICESQLPFIWNGILFDAAGEQDTVLTASTGADSTVVMTLHVLPVTYATIDTIVLENDLPLQLNGQIYQTDSTFTQILAGANAYGCDSLLTVNLTVHYNVTTELSDTICETALPFTWNGILFNAAGVQDTVLTASTGVDSTVVMTLQVLPTTYATIDTIVLENDLPLQLNGQTYMSDSTFTQILAGANAYGCDSILTVTLTVRNNLTTEIFDTICETALPFTWNGILFDAAGVQDTVLTSSTGVDSTVVMSLHVVPTTYASIDTIVLENDLPLQLNGQTYQTDSTFTQTLVGANAYGCDSLLTVNLTIRYNVTTELSDTICETELPFTWNGILFEAAGVQDTMQTASTGVDSTVVMTLHVLPTTYGTLDTIVLENDLPLQLNGQTYQTDSTFTQTLAGANAYGCDSILTVNLIILKNDTTYLDTTICDNEFPFTWNEIVFSTPGTQSVLYTAANGTDSLVVMTVDYNPTTYGSLDTAVFQNDLPFVYYGESYSIPGIYTQVIENSAGCDSIVTINMEEIYNVVAFADSVVCAVNTPFVWNGYIFTQTATQMVILPASTGADSMLVMTVTVVYTTYGSMDTTVLENDLPFVLNGESYTTPGYKIQMLNNYAGCDSVLTINLQILYNVTVYDDSLVCESELPMIWNGLSFERDDIQANTQTITQSALLTASTGVDSTVVMTLHVLPNTYATMDTVVLENDLPLQLNGQTYMLDSTYTQTLVGANVNGCDSILTVNLTIRYNVTTELSDTICETELPFTWNGILFEAAGVQDTMQTASTGVDSTVVMTLHVLPTTYGTLDTIVLENDLPLQLNGHTYMSDSTFTQTLAGANSNGCDSILTVNLTVLYNVMTELSDTICESQLPFIWNGVTFVADSISEDTHSFTQSTVLTASTGVDSTVVMTVIVHYATTGIDVQTACDSYTWMDGVTYTSSTETATYILTNAVGCDSVVTLHLTINHSETTQDTIVLVENQLPYHFTPSDTTIAAGSPEMFHFNYHLLTSHDCDSTIEQTVIVHYNTSATVDTMVCESSLPYTWHGHVYSGEGTFTDTLLNADGSSHYVTWHLTVSSPSVTIQNTHHITCYGGSDGSVGVLVNGGIQPYNCHWENAAGGTVSATAQLNNRPAGQYTLYVTDAIGCQVTETVMLNHLNDTMIAGTIANDQSVCLGEHLVAFTGTAATGGANSSYQWQISTNGTNWTAAQTPNNAQNYTYPNAVTMGFYLRRAWISTQCGTVYSNTVSVTPLPLYDDTIHATVCQGYPYQEYGFDVAAEATAIPAVIMRNLQLQSSHGCDSAVTLLLTVLPSSYTTVTDESCQNAPYQENGFDIAGDQLTATGLHSFEKVYTTSGCDSIVTLQLTIHPAFELNLEDVVCEGDGYNNHGFVVSPGQTVGETELNLTQNLQSQLGCDSVVNMHLTVVDTAIAIVSLTPEFCDEYSAELSVETNMSDYLWSTGETSQTIMVTQPGTYTVTATQDHCAVSAWYQIENCELNVYRPNTITPGIGDGLNDYFCLHEKYLPMIDDFEIRIYTRWGELIYYSDDKNFKWNGEYRGRINRQIIYTYLINFTDNRGTPHQLTGSITVL